MNTILKINNLNYQDFRNINISFEKSKFYFIVGGNRSGKTTLFRLISSLIFTKNLIRCGSIVLDEDSRNTYIKQIGAVERVNNISFHYKTVQNEMLYPLINLGYSNSNALNRINEVLSIFNANNLLERNINDLSYQEKQLLLLMISLLHHPKVILLDGILDVYSESTRKKIINKLKEIIDNEGITILNFSTNLNNIMDSDRIIILSDFKIIKETTYNEIYDNDKLFYENGLEIPFIFDLVNKLKMYNLINNNYTNMKDMVDDIWP